MELSEELLGGNDFIYSVSCHLSRRSHYAHAPRDSHSLRKHAEENKYTVRASLTFMFNLPDRCNCIIYRYR